MLAARTKMFTLLCLVFLAAGEALAQETTLLHQLTLERGAWVHFAMVEGRIVFRCTQPISYGNARNGPKSRESYQLSNENGREKLVYQRTTEEEVLKIDADADAIHIRRVPKGQSSFPVVDFQQAGGGKTSLTIGDGAAGQTLTADDCWRLFLAYPKECGQYLSPLLAYLRPDWGAAAATAAVEAKLLQTSGDDVAAARDRWAAIVKQLGDDRFARREAADRALRAGGSAALGYLRQLPSKRLDAEQRFRIRRIIDDLGEQCENARPDEIASFLAADPEVWMLLLERPEPAARRAAVRVLAAMLGGRVDVDPDATPDSQRTKRERLRAEIRERLGSG